MFNKTLHSMKKFILALAAFAMTAGLMSAQDLATPQNAGKALAALLGGASVTVTDGAMGDLEALVARLKNENERTRFSMLMTSLASIGQSLDETQRQTLERGIALSEKLEELNKMLEGYSGDEAKAKADAAILQAKIDALQKRIDQAVKDGKEHNELVAELKRVRAELDAKNQVIADTQGKIAETKNAISSVKSQISVLVKSIGENTVKTIADELAALSEPEKAERPAETGKREAKEAENDPLAAIRDSLAKIGRDLAETIEENRIETV